MFVDEAPQEVPQNTEVSRADEKVLIFGHLSPTQRLVGMRAPPKGRRQGPQTGARAPNESLVRGEPQEGGKKCCMGHFKTFTGPPETAHGGPDGDRRNGTRGSNKREEGQLGLSEPHPSEWTTQKVCHKKAHREWARNGERYCERLISRAAHHTEGTTICVWCAFN